MKFISSVISVFVVIAITATANAAVYSVDQKKNRFNPKTITLKAGDSITFKNSDGHKHHVGNDQMKFNKLLPAGKTFTQLFDKQGRFEVRCVLHPIMKLTVNVN